jgi:hypothetical protein
MAFTPWPPLPRLGERGSNDGAQPVISFVPYIVGEGLEIPGSIGQFQCARHNEGEIGGGVGSGGKNGELLDIAKRHIYTANFLTDKVIENY